uniref:Reverse transcriptase domain-containing protein n=1 Tax=Nicotiana tabacum TaxID=4097 RepID=A0A1S3Z4P2_TOBAC|nr:PREDICTED: uncharacterized protein LOC107782759 [Nicotiana tabacum]
MDTLTRHIQGEVSWYMLFADDIISIDESRRGADDRLEVWRQTLESKGFKLGRTKMEYLECKFSEVTQEADMSVRLDTQVILRRESFKLDKIMNEVIRDMVGVAPMEHKMREARLR